MNRLQKLLLSFVVALVITIVYSFGVLYSLDNRMADTLYQRGGLSEGDIEVIGIDAKSLEQFGRFQDWDRDILGQVLAFLNQDPDNRPAAIGVDTLFIGETTQSSDDYLVSCAALYDNVVLACYADFGIEYAKAEGKLTVNNRAVLDFQEPFPALAAVSRLGHINSMYDGDGVFRHAMLYIDLPDGRRIASFHYELYKLYADEYGLDSEIEPPLEDNFWYLPFTDRPGSYYQGIGVADILNGTVSSEHFAGRIVLIGPYAAGLQDNYLTAIDYSENMYGVEYQANAIEALICADFKESVSDKLQSFLLFVIVFFCMYWFIDRKILPCTLVWLLLAAVWLGAGAVLYRFGFIIHPLWVPLAVTILYIATVALNYVSAAREKRRITGAFKKYVAPEIVNELLKQGSDALSVSRMTDIAVLFVDIRGFTTMSELLEPAQVVEMLNQYLALTSTCIMNNRGTLDKFIGDATMAFWGAPLPQEDYIYNAVKTAMEMIEGSEAVSKDLLERFGRTVSFGIGVHCGPAIVGNIGSPNRMDYTAIGDTVNTASRLESNAPGGQLLISRAVADALIGRIEVTSLGDTIKLKGKAAGFEILRVDRLLINSNEDYNKSP